MEVPQPPNLRKRRSEAVLGDDEKERQQEIQDDRAMRAEILEARWLGERKQKMSMCVSQHANGFCVIVAVAKRRRHAKNVEAVVIVPMTAVQSA